MHKTNCWISALIVVTIAGTMLSCTSQDQLSQEVGDDITRTESQSQEDDTGSRIEDEEAESHPFLSPNDDLIKEAKPGSNGYEFVDNYNDLLPAWSPNDQFIAFVSYRDGDTDVYVMNADGSNLTNLTPDPSQVIASFLFWSEKSVDTCPDWSPDGDEIVFSSSRTNIMMMSVPVDVFIMALDGSGVIQITDTVDTDAFPDWSPDGTKILFVSDRHEGVQIYTMNPDGSEVKKLTEEGMDNDLPAWSPDGALIAFESNRDGDYDIYTMNSYGEDINQLTDSLGTDSQPSWSPDGSRIVFTSDRDGDDELYIMDSDGSNVVQITENTVDDRSPDWSHKGDRIVFTSETLEGRRIFVTDVEGRSVTQLTGGPAEISPIENAVFHLHRALALHYYKMRFDEGEFDTIIDAYSTVIELDPEIAEAYFGRGLATLLRCEIIWLHVVGSTFQIQQWNDECPEVEAAVEDIEAALNLGLAPGITLAVENLIKILK